MTCLCDRAYATFLIGIRRHPQRRYGILCTHMYTDVPIKTLGRHCGGIDAKNQQPLRKTKTNYRATMNTNRTQTTTPIPKRAHVETNMRKYAKGNTAFQSLGRMDTSTSLSNARKQIFSILRTDGPVHYLHPSQRQFCPRSCEAFCTLGFRNFVRCFRR